MKKMPIFLVLAMVCMAFVARAQNVFAKKVEGDTEVFVYKYFNLNNKVELLGFRLHQPSVNVGSQEFNTFESVNKKARQQGIEAAAKVLRDLELTGFTIDVDMQNEKKPLLVLSSTTPKNPEDTVQAYERFHEAYQQGYKSALSGTLYEVVEQDGNLDAKVNYQAVVERYAPVMMPVVRGLESQIAGNRTPETPRVFINAALSWLQTIPYDQLNNARTSNGAGFQTPYGLIANNKGDCETKTVALAALIRNKYPGMPLAVVELPDHVFLAIGLPQSGQDYAVTTPQGVMILADPVGPNPLPLGQLYESIQEEIWATGTRIIPLS